MGKRTAQERAQGVPIGRARDEGAHVHEEARALVVEGVYAGRLVGCRQDLEPDLARLVIRGRGLHECAQ